MAAEIIYYLNLSNHQSIPIYDSYPSDNDDFDTLGLRVDFSTLAVDATSVLSPLGRLSNNAVALNLPSDLEAFRTSLMNAGVVVGVGVGSIHPMLFFGNSAVPDQTKEGYTKATYSYCVSYNSNRGIWPVIRGDSFFTGTGRLFGHLSSYDNKLEFSFIADEGSTSGGAGGSSLLGSDGNPITLENAGQILSTVPCRPCYQLVNGEWVKQTVYERANNVWVKISQK